MRKTYDLVVKGGEILDPSQSIHKLGDIAIKDGKITFLGSVPDIEASTVVDAQGCLVTPGLIDLHAHVAKGVIELGANPDAAGVLRGVTTVCDGGSAGPANFEALKTSIIGKARTDVFCFLHVARLGLSMMPEIRAWKDIDEEGALRTASENRDTIKGIKVRAIGAIAEGIGLEAIRRAKLVARQVGIPLMVHIGDGMAGSASHLMDAFTLRVVELLDRGDVISHIYVGQIGSVLKVGQSVPKQLKEAITRGVVLDTAHGRPNLSFLVARWGLDNGVLPTTISTDLAATNVGGPIYSLLLTMSKFLALGLSIDQVVEMTTVNPARVIDEVANRGTLRVGAPADVTVIDMRDGAYTFVDGFIGNKIQGKTLLLPRLTLKNGVPIIPTPGAEREVA